MTWRGIWLGVALLSVANASPSGAEAHRPARTPSFTISLLSTIPEHRRYLTMAAFARAMRACTFFEGRNPLRDIAAGKRSTYSYGGLCRGPYALAPE
jgi:hypothetical protein